MDTNEIKAKILQFFDALPHVVFIVLFGSYAQGKETTTSDVDVAVFFERAHVPTGLTLIEWQEDLSGLLEKDVDLVCLNLASPILGMQVYQYGKILKVLNEKEVAKYQMQLFYDYSELKEIRAPMEENILNRKIHD